jgi:hypothetical protein
MERLFQNPSEKEKHGEREGPRASRWSATTVAKKLGKNLSSPLTEAGLLMEDAETPRKSRKSGATLRII